MKQELKVILVENSIKKELENVQALPLEAFLVVRSALFNDNSDKWALMKAIIKMKWAFVIY